MRRLLIPLLLASPPLAAIAPYAGAPVARAARVEGWVEISDGALARRWELPRNAPLLPGDRFELQAGARLLIRLDDGGRLVLAGPAKLAIGKRSRGETEIRLLRGELWVDNPGRLEMRVRSDYGALDVAPGGRALLFCGGNGVDAYAVEGEARRVPPRNAPPADRARPLPEGRQIRLADGALGPPEAHYVADAEALAGWGIRRAARPRDARLAAWLAEVIPAAEREELVDLDEAGEWREEGGGWAWFPRETGGWAPFTRGGWRWTAGGLFWIPEESWGWLPYRFGSWHHLPDGGWRWRPDDQYTGASVVFFPLDGGWGWSAAYPATGGGWVPATPEIWQFEGGGLFGENPIARALPVRAPPRRPRAAPASAPSAPAEAPPARPQPQRAIAISKPQPGKPVEGDDAE